MDEHTETVPNDSPQAAWPPEGWVRREDVARMFGIAPDTLKHWYRVGRLRFGKDVAKPGGGRCKIYPVAELQRLKAEMDAERGRLPQGYVRREEAAAVFNLSVSGWKKWRHMGRVTGGRMVSVPGERSLVKVYPLDELLRLREELEREGEFRPDAVARAAIKARRKAEDAARRPPAGVVGFARACEMFGVTEGVWQQWMRKGWVRGTKYGPKWYFEKAELERLLDENGRMRPPYPDPDRPGCYRLPVRTATMRCLEALIDAESLPLVEGRQWNWIEGGLYGGFIALSHRTKPVALRRVVLGITDTWTRVSHANGDPLDCRRANLVVRTMKESARSNQKKGSVNGREYTSKYKGVCWDERNGRWLVQINADGVHRNLGRYHDEEYAALVYDGAAREAYGGHAWLNFPQDADEEARRLREAAAKAREARARQGVFPPAGFVEKSEVARLLGVNPHRVWKCEQRGLLSGGKMVLKPGTQGLVKVFPEEQVRRLAEDRRKWKEAPFPPEGFVDSEGAAALLGISPNTLHNWTQNGKLGYAGRLVRRPNGTFKIYDVDKLRRARDEMDAANAAAEALPEGMVNRDRAAAFLGVTDVTLNRWEREEWLRCGTWIEQPDGKRRKVYRLADLERERREMEVARADRSRLPEGFVDQEEACRILGVTPVTLSKWQREGKVDFAQWGRSRTYKPCRIYARDELDRFMAQMRATEAIRDRENPREYHIPPGWVRQVEAAHLFGVEYATFHRWELEGRITCGTREVGAGIKLYPIDQLKRMLEECGKYSPPYPDPDRPGVYRVPLAGRDMERREAIIDAADVALLEGKRCHWSDGRPDQPGQVIVWDGNDTIRLRQLIMGVSGTEWRVGHRNGDTLDCRRENLFVRTKQEQARGARKMKCYGGEPCSSRFKGVCFEKFTGRWRAAIVVDGKTKRLGRFRDEIAAAEAYDEAARDLFGEYARLNFPDGVDARLEREANTAQASREAA